MSLKIVIPARYGSERLPGKPLQEISGRPMVLCVADRAAAAYDRRDIVVATDDQRIYDVVTEANYEVMMTPNSLLTGSDRVGWVAKTLDVDFIVNLQGDEPMMTPEVLTSAISMVEDRGFDIGTAASQFSTFEEFAADASVKVTLAHDGAAISFSRLGIPHSRVKVDLIGDIGAYRHIGVYAYRKDVLLDLVSRAPIGLERFESLEQLRAQYYGYRIGCGLVNYQGISVDTQEDLDEVRKLLV